MGCGWQSCTSSYDSPQNESGTFNSGDDACFARRVRLPVKVISHCMPRWSDGEPEAETILCTLADPLIPTDFLRKLWPSAYNPTFRPSSLQSGALLGDVEQLAEVTPNLHAAAVSETSDIGVHRRTWPTSGALTNAPPTTALFILWRTSNRPTLLIPLPFQRED